MSFLEDKNVSIAMLQETWLKACDKSIFEEIKNYGYKILSKMRTIKRGGGTTFLYKSNLQIKKSFTELQNCFSSFEHIAGLFNHNRDILKLVNIYRPPYSVKFPITTRSFLDEFESFLSKIQEFRGHLIIAGDFNLNLKDTNSAYAKEFLELLEKYNLMQLVNSSTHVKGGMIDFIIVEKTIICQIGSVETILDFKTDHYPIHLSLKTNLMDNHENCKPIIKNVRDINSIDIGSCIEEIKMSPLVQFSVVPALSLDDYINIYNSFLSKLFDDHCPVVTKKYRYKHRNSLWFNPTLQTLKRAKRKAERRLRKNFSQGNVEHLRLSRNRYNVELKRARSEFYQKKLFDSKQDSKTLYKTLHKLTGNIKERTQPSFDSEEVISEKMSEYYIQKVSKIRSDIQADFKPHQQHTYTVDYCFNQFSAISIKDLELVFSSMKRKTCLLDPIPTSVLFKFVDILYPFVLNVVNLIMEQSEFPSSLKQSIITPVVKDESKSADDFKNTRPVNNLPFISKVVERVMYLQLNYYIESNGMHAVHQSSYRAHHSCETGMVRVMGDIQESVLRKENVALVMLDSSSAFDTVDHELLLNKLKFNFGIKGKALQLIQSYLQGRTFSVKVGNTQSQPKRVLFGVPQGSLLGPLFYILYTK